MHRVRCGRVLNTKFLCLSPRKSGPCYPPDTSKCDKMQNIGNRGGSPVIQFLLGFHYVGMTNWIIGSSPPQRPSLCYIQSPNPLNLCLVFLEWLVPILSHLISINYGGRATVTTLVAKLLGPSMNNKNTITWECKRVQRLPCRNRRQARQIFYYTAGQDWN